MLTLKKVAVTGGIASGKSSVCKIFGKLGAYIVSADAIVHGLLQPATPLGHKIVQLLGSDVLNQNQLDHAKIAEKVFHNDALLDALEGLLHPAVFDAIEEEYQRAWREGRAIFFVAEIPLLFESKLTQKHHFDAVVAVTAAASICRQRFAAAGHHTKEEFDKRQRRHLSQEEKARRADYVIVNNGSLEELEQAVINVKNKIEKMTE